jgi:hypothetical protein
MPKLAYLTAVNPKIAEAFMAHGHVMSTFETFQDIPQGLRGEAHLVGWLLECGSLCDIPASYRTDLIFEAAAAHESSALSQIKPEDTTHYEALALIALKRNPTQIKYVPAHILTEDFVIKACINSRGLIRQIVWSDDNENGVMVTKHLVNQIGSQSLIHACELVNAIGDEDRDLLTDESIRAAIKVSVADLIRLRDLGALPILQDMVDKGYWPPESDKTIQFDLSAGRDYRLRPATPAEVLERLTGVMGLSYSILNTRVMKSFPIEDVITTLSQDQSSLDLLFKLYTADELRPHMRLSQRLKGRLLEEDLGL